MPSSLSFINNIPVTITHLTHYTIPDNVIAINDCCFATCYHLLQITFPSTVKYIGNHAFYHCFYLLNLPQFAIQEPVQPMITDQEMNIIEEWSESQFIKVLYDTDINSNLIGNGELYEQLFNKQNILLLFEDSNGNLFGEYVHSKITKIERKSELFKNEATTKDPCSFVFTLRSRNRFNHPMKFDIKTDHREWTLYVRLRTLDTPLIIGRGDITIARENTIERSFCRQVSFNYFDFQNVFIGKISDRNTRKQGFLLKRFQIIQMKETDEKIQRIEEQVKEMKKNREEKYHNEIELLEIRQEEVFELYEYYIHQIEEWTGLTRKKLVFDSDCCNWSIDTSTFDLHLMNKHQLAFLIQTV